MVLKWLITVLFYAMVSHNSVNFLQTSCWNNIIIITNIKSTASSLDRLRSDVHVTTPVQVKFINRSRREVQLEWVNPQGHREKKKLLQKGRCWRTSTWEGHCWVCCDPKHSNHLFALNYALHYRVQKTRRLRERVVITAGIVKICVIQCVKLCRTVKLPDPSFSPGSH